MASILRGIDNLDSADIVKDSTCESDIAPYNKGFKNYIINGNFDVWQYGTSQTSSGYGSDDRWRNTNSGSTKTHSMIACTDTERALFNSSFFSRTVVSSVAGANNNVQKFQLIENVAKLAGKTVTVSFWAKADSTKNIAIEFGQIFGTGGNPSATVSAVGAQLIPLTSTWQKITRTFTFPSIVGKTIGTDGVHTSSTYLVFWFDAGSSFNSRSANLGQQSGTFDIAQVQLEEGSVATPFEQRPFALELSLCQRYYQKFVQNGASGELYSHERAYLTAAGVTYITKTIPFKVPMRTTPTITIPRVYNQGTDYDSDWAVYTSGLNGGMGGITIYKGISTNINGIIAFDAIASAEL